jgi:dTDP-4-dehydrorhamnose reductase
MKALIVGGKGQLGTTLTQTVPDGIDYRSLDLPEFDITDPKTSRQPSAMNNRM